MDKLPQEILYDIAEQLSTDSLKASRLVCRALNPIAAACLFRNLQISGHHGPWWQSTPWWQESPSDWRQLTSIPDTSTICSLVRGLCLSGYLSSNEFNIRNILQKFPLLQKLVVSDEPGVRNLLFRISSAPVIGRLLHLEYYSFLLEDEDLPSPGNVKANLSQLLGHLTCLRLHFDTYGKRGMRWRSMADYESYDRRLPTILQHTNNLSILSLTGSSTVIGAQTESAYELNSLLSKRNCWSYLRKLTLGNVCSNTSELVQFLVAHESCLRDLTLENMLLHPSQDANNGLQVGWIHIFKTMRTGMSLQRCSLAGHLSEHGNDRISWWISSKSSDELPRFRTCYSEMLTFSPDLPNYFGGYHEPPGLDQNEDLYHAVVDYILGRRAEFPMSEYDSFIPSYDGNDPQSIRFPGDRSCWGLPNRYSDLLAEYLLNHSDDDEWISRSY